MSEPTTGEVMRRLDEVARQMTDLARELRADRVAAGETFVRKDVYASDRADHERRIAEREDADRDRERAQDAFRRQVLLGLVMLALPALASLVLAVNNLLATGGATP